MKTYPSDNELVEKLQKGDPEAFDIVFAKYSVKLYAFGIKYLRSKADAEELVQSVFLKVWENAKSLRKESSFKSYLFTIAYNQICKLFRKRGYEQKFISEAQRLNHEPTTDIEDSIDYGSVLERVQMIIEKLPAKQKTIFMKSRMEGKSTREIAAEVGLAPGTVDNYISSALKFILSRMHSESLPVVLLFLLFFH